MLKYLKRDLLGMVKYAPYGILMGCSLYLLIVIWGSKKRQGKQSFSWSGLLFWVYAATMLVITFWSRESGSVRMDLQIGSSLGINVRNDAYIVENVLLFVPFGFLLGLAWLRQKAFGVHLMFGFLTSLGIESLQLISGRGIFQIDDIITNTAGSALGYALFWVAVGRRHRKKAG